MKAQSFHLMTAAITHMVVESVPTSSQYRLKFSIPVKASNPSISIMDLAFSHCLRWITKPFPYPIKTQISFVVNKTHVKDRNLWLGAVQWIYQELFLQPQYSQVYTDFIHTNKSEENSLLVYFRFEFKPNVSLIQQQVDERG